jgi:hypothetical protein
MVFAIVNKNAIIMKIIVSLLLACSTIVAIWGAWCRLILLFIWFVHYSDSADLFGGKKIEYKFLKRN